MTSPEQIAKVLSRYIKPNMEGIQRPTMNRYLDEQHTLIKKATDEIVALLRSHPTDQEPQ